MCGGGGAKAPQPLSPSNDGSYGVTNNVDKTVYLGGTGNVNGIQIFPVNSKEMPSPMVKICQNLVNVVYERTLFSTTNNDQPTESMTIAIKGIQRHNGVAFVFVIFHTSLFKV